MPAPRAGPTGCSTTSSRTPSPCDRRLGLSTPFVEKLAAGGAELAVVRPKTVRDRKIILVLDVATVSKDVVSTGPLLLRGATFARCASLLSGHAGRQNDERHQQNRQISNHCDPPTPAGIA